MFKKSIAMSLFAGLVLTSFSTVAAELPAPLQSKVEKYKQKLVEWAANPVIVSAVKEANSKGGLQGMSNSKWLEVAEKDPIVMGFINSKAGALIAKWDSENPEVEKIVVRDEKGNLVAASTKPLLYSNSVRPVYQNAIKGQVWSDNKVLPDPTTQTKSVQASAPVMDGGKAIGVIHFAVKE